MYHRSLIFAALVTIVGIGLPASAVEILFNFEELDATAIPDAGGPPTTHPGDLTTLVSTKGGLTATITKAGDSFDVVSNILHQAKPNPVGDEWLTKSLDPFADLTTTPFLVSFSSATPFTITSVEALFGDYNGEDDGGDNDDATLMAFTSVNGTGAEITGPLSSDMIENASTGPPTAGADGFTWDRVSVAGSGINSVLLNSLSRDGSVPLNGGRHSVFWDNIRVEVQFDNGNENSAVPEPTAFVLCGMALIGLVAAAGWGTRRR